MLTFVYKAQNSNNNDKRVIGIAQLSLSAVLKINNDLQGILASTVK